MRNVDLYDAYLEGSMNAAEKATFELRLNQDEVFARAFEEHKTLVASLQAFEQASDFKSKLNHIHVQEFGNTKVVPIKEETFAKRYGKTVVVAASTALIAVLSTVAILSTGGFLMFSKANDQFTELKREVNELKASSEGIVTGLTKPKKIVYAPANLEGSAFALNNQGYILTSFHMVNGSDSVFIENKNISRTSAKIILTDPKLDLAVLKVDGELAKDWQVPYSFSGKVSDIGEKVFTLGYPRKDMVYGEGSLSSLSGYYSDTTMYQVSIPVNPGNSGGPLLDEQGHVIGVIRGKITSAEGTGFAVKSLEIVRSISELSNDSIAPLAKKPGMKGLKRTEQIKRINPYVFNVLVYKN